MFKRGATTIRRNLVAWLALFVALSGTSFAASHYIITSTKQIKPSVLKALKAEGRTGPEGRAGSARTARRPRSARRRGNGRAAGASGTGRPARRQR